MPNVIQKICEDKRLYREQMKKMKALPEGYQFVFKKIQGYMWSFAGGNGLDMLQTQYDLIELFESGAADGQHVLDVTGKDVASFCDELMRDNHLWIDRQRKKINHDINRQLGDSENSL